MRILLMIAGLVTAQFSTSAETIKNSNLDVNFEKAAIAGQGSQITIYNAPITNKETGKTSYFDITARFSVDREGKLIFDEVSQVEEVLSKNANVLRPGVYQSTKNKCKYRVSAPVRDVNGYALYSMGLEVQENEGIDCSTFTLSLSNAPKKKNIYISKHKLLDDVDDAYSGSILGVGDASQFSTTSIMLATMAGKRLTISELVNYTGKMFDDTFDYIWVSE